MVDGQLMSTVNIILMSIQHCLPTGDPNGMMNVLSSLNNLFLPLHWGPSRSKYALGI